MFQLFYLITGDSIDILCWDKYTQDTSTSIQLYDHEGDIELNSQNYNVTNALMELQTDKKRQASLNQETLRFVQKK